MTLPCILYLFSGFFFYVQYTQKIKRFLKFLRNHCTVFARMYTIFGMYKWRNGIQANPEKNM